VVPHVSRVIVVLSAGGLAWIVGLAASTRLTASTLWSVRRLRSSCRVDSDATRRTVTRLVERVAWRRSEGSEPALALAAFDALASALRSGHSLLDGLRHARDAADPVWAGRLAPVLRDLERGRSIEVAVAPLAMAADPSARLLAGVLTIGVVTGGALAPAVDAARSTVRQRIVLSQELASLTVQARLSAAVMAVLPIGFVALSALVDGRTAAFLFTTPWGWLCLAVGLSLEAVGAAWMSTYLRALP